MTGIFDSGLGGLTALKEIHRLMPGEDLIYFGDTGRVPYGTRSKETIIRYSKQDAAFLLSKGVDAIVVACGTVSATSLDILSETLPVPVIGVVEPAAEAAVKATRNGKIAVIGTTATIKSGAFEKKLREISPFVKIITRDCPLFVPLVENGFIGGDCEITRLTCEHYLSDIRDSGADTLILGCTHYPIISGIIANILPGVTLINTGEEAAKKLLSVYGERSGKKSTSIKYYVSDDPGMFSASASLFLGSDIRGVVEKVYIENY